MRSREVGVRAVLACRGLGGGRGGAAALSAQARGLAGSSGGAGGGREGGWWAQRGDPARARPRLARLTAATPLRAEADAAAESLVELQRGELVEAIGDIDDSAFREWLLVRAPLEDKVDSMSDKPLEYCTGWLHWPELEHAEHQLGDKVAARVDVASSHPVLGLLRRLPPWREKGPPAWVSASVAELYPGSVEGVAQCGRFLVQRPSGALPERLATSAQLLVPPRARLRQTALAGLAGLALSALLGAGAHVRAWSRGEDLRVGRMAWPQFVGWASIAAVFLTPAAVLPCYGFANSQASTACVVACINLLFYNDLFGE
mmetsp:Transcript_125908/g.350804  ORF Transcript_125908/g.350804 Transcript_125908/m.350804 type:complete len:317 (+) Transcript_125908:71-1021(+)